MDALSFRTPPPVELFPFQLFLSGELVFFDYLPLRSFLLDPLSASPPTATLLCDPSSAFAVFRASP